MNIILLSGGSGKRLWPLSNDIRSKQFIKIFILLFGKLQILFKLIGKLNVVFHTSRAALSASILE